MILVVKNLVSSAESFSESFVSFCFDFAAENYYDDADQNSCNIAESYFFFLSFR